MTTYTINNRPKLLAPGDEVVFVVKGKELHYYTDTAKPGSYIKCYSWTDDGYRAIFNVLGLDARAFASEAYGYPAGRGEWPKASSHGDFPALTRLVNALYDRIASLEPVRPCEDCPLVKKEVGHNLLPVGAWVKITHGSSRVGHVGEIVSVDIAGDPIAPYEVKYSDGSTGWKCWDFVEPVANWERFKIGDYVEGLSEKWGREHTRKGRIECFDKSGPSGEHWRIEDEEGELYWLKDSSIRLAEKPKAKAFRPGDTVRLLWGSSTPAGFTGVVLGDADNSGYDVRLDAPEGVVVRWAHPNLIEHYRA